MDLSEYHSSPHGWWLDLQSCASSECFKVPCSHQRHVVVVLLLMFLIIESPTIRVLGSTALWAECRCLLDLERLLVAMLAAGWFNPCLVTFRDSSPTFINASNLFSRCMGGCKIPVFTSLVIAVSGVEDARAAIRDSQMSRVPLGLSPCLCHRLVCQSVSACSSTVCINCWDSLDSQDLPAVCWGGPWWPSAVCSACFVSPASDFVSRTAILCRSLWQFMQQVSSSRGIFSRLFECRQLCFSISGM